MGLRPQCITGDSEDYKQLIRSRESTGLFGNLDNHHIRKPNILPILNIDAGFFRMIVNVFRGDRRRMATTTVMT